MTPYTTLLSRLYWQRDQFSKYALVFVYDDWSRVGAVDRLDICNQAIHLYHNGQVITRVDWYCLNEIVQGNDRRLEDMRAAIIRMDDCEWDEIASGL